MSALIAAPVGPDAGRPVQVMRDASICGLGRRRRIRWTACCSTSRTNWHDDDRPDARRDASRAHARRPQARTRGREPPRVARRRRRDPAPCATAGLTPVGNCRACVVEVDGERVLARCAPHAGARDAGRDRQRARPQVAEDGARTAAGRHARGGVRAAQRRRLTGGERWAVGKRPAAAAQPAADLSHPAIAGQPGRLHPVHALPARLPRRAGQRRHRLAFRGEHAKIVFDMDDAMGRRPAWPAANACRPAHRRAGAGARGRRRGAGPQVARSVPVLRRGLPADLTNVRDNRIVASRAATGRPTTAGCASRAATASTTPTTRTG